MAGVDLLVEGANDVVVYAASESARPLRDTAAISVCARESAVVRQRPRSAGVLADEPLRKLSQLTSRSNAFNLVASLHEHRPVALVVAQLFVHGLARTVGLASHGIYDD